MDQPHIASKSPAVIELEPGTYWWCRCGLSKNQPFCDGAHATTSFTPQEIKLSEARRVALCNCKHSENGPMCDGTHARL